MRRTSFLFLGLTSCILVCSCTSYAKNLSKNVNIPEIRVILTAEKVDKNQSKRICLGNEFVMKICDFFEINSIDIFGRLEVFDIWSKKERDRRQTVRKLKEAESEGMIGFWYFFGF